MEFCPVSRHKDFCPGVAFDFSSNSSDSSVAGPPEGCRPESREKVCAWLRGDHCSRQDRHGDASHNCTEKLLENKRTYETQIAPSKDKVQCLLSYGEYSLFKHWKVLAEGDFIPFKPCAKGQEAEVERKLCRKRRKVCVSDIRTLAITKNWLLLGRLYRLYQVDKDCIVPGGICLELRRLVPLRYLRVCVARPRARVIGIANQNGVFKQYQMLDKPDCIDGDPFCTWQQVIGELHPNLSDKILYQTLNIFEQWQKRHSCRLTVHPGYENKSAITLSDWQVKLGEKEPEKCRCEGAASISHVTGCVMSVGDSIPMSASEVEGVLTSFGSEKALSEIDSSNGAPHVVARLSRESIESRPHVAARFSRESMESSDVERAVTMVREVSENDETYYRGPTLLAASTSSTSSGTGVTRAMPPPSAGRRRRSIKNIFRLGFLSTKTKRKGKPEGSTPSPDAGPPPQNSNRLLQRRVSRLEMNEPIEDIFSEIKFETMQKRPSASGDVHDDDISDDVIEDPEVVLSTIVDGKAVAHDYENDYLVHDDSTKPDSRGDGTDVTDPKLLERELLLPRPDCSVPVLNYVSDAVTSEGDLR